ncbi:hypothetical protein A6A04_13475 [Paramagnetospirillum marisnigri]|uniref:Uncharacterized protein n=1 Tax=Paramagnetospirillum marisnigri TaxID=1285242 RepID=A0A178MV03_9PROT|nr:hypothetical protein [Paramagnetospirillum marisnigri]OAN53897.1 hypothetical protein A6A04_13475 [Paramagnetospirillum marisnigri]
MTPYVLGVLAKAEADDRRGRQDQMAWHAWHSAAFQRCKKMPTLKEVMGQKAQGQGVEARLKATLKTAFPIKRRAER